MTYNASLHVVKDLGTVRFDDIELDVARRADESYSWVRDEFGSVRGDVTWTMEFRRGDWSARTHTRTILTCDATDFSLHAQLDAYEGEQRVLSQNWSRTIPRDLL